MISYRDAISKREIIFLERWIDVVAGLARFYPQMPINEIYSAIAGAEHGNWHKMCRFGFNKKMVTGDLHAFMLKRFGFGEQTPVCTKLKALARATFFVWNAKRKARKWRKRA